MDRALGGEKPVVGTIRDYNMVAIYKSFGNCLCVILLSTVAGHCPSRLPEVLSIVYCPKSKCAITRHGGHMAKIWPCSCTSVA